MREEEEDFNTTMNTQTGSAILGVQDAQIPCRRRLLELHRTSAHRPTYRNGSPIRDMVASRKMQAASRVMSFLATCVHDHMLSLIRDAQRGVGKSQEDYLREHIRAQASTPPRVE